VLVWGACPRTGTSPFPLQSLLRPPPCKACSQSLLGPGQPCPLLLTPPPQVDLEGKRAAWEGIVKIPFVDEVGAEARAAHDAEQTCLALTRAQLCPS